MLLSAWTTGVFALDCKILDAVILKHSETAAAPGELSAEAFLASKVFSARNPKSYIRLPSACAGTSTLHVRLCLTSCHEQRTFAHQHRYMYLTHTFTVQTLSSRPEALATIVGNPLVVPDYYAILLQRPFILPRMAKSARSPNFPHQNSPNSQHFSVYNQLWKRGVLGNSYLAFSCPLLYTRYSP